MKSLLKLTVTWKTSLNVFLKKPSVRCPDRSIRGPPLDQAPNIAEKRLWRDFFCFSNCLSRIVQVSYETILIFVFHSDVCPYPYEPFWNFWNFFLRQNKIMHLRREDFTHSIVSQIYLFNGKHVLALVRKESYFWCRNKRW